MENLLKTEGISYMGFGIVEKIFIYYRKSQRDTVKKSG